MRGWSALTSRDAQAHFPSFSEGLSLRATKNRGGIPTLFPFPFLFGGTFIEGSDSEYTPDLLSANFPSFSEGLSLRDRPLLFCHRAILSFPFLFGGTFIEGNHQAGEE